MSNNPTLAADPPTVSSDDAPQPWREIRERYPEVVAAYDALREVCNVTGPLVDPTLSLIKLAVSVGARVERTVHAHTRKALAAGIEPDALRQAVFVALPTIGLPAALDALRWVDESIHEASVLTRPGAGTRRLP